MADQKISQLTDGGASQAADEYVIARSGANYRIDGASVAAAATSVGTLTSLTVSGDLTVDTSTLKVDSANNRVGVGTATPTDALDVRGVLAAGNGTVKTIISYSTLGIFGTESNHALSLITNGSEKARLDASGNLGLGVTPSAWANAVALEVDFPGNALWGFSAAEFNVLQNTVYSSGGFRYGSNGAASRYEQNTGAHRWYTAASGTAGNAITFTQAMTLDASGVLTVGYGGTGSQDAVIDLDAGNASGGEAYMRLRRNSTTQLLLSTDGSTIDLRGVANIPLTFWTNNAERAQITAGGYFKASDTGSYVGSTASYHEFRNSANAIGVVINPSNASFTSAALYINTNKAAGSDFQLITCAANDVEQVRVRGDGTIYAQNTTVQSISDARLKENISTATDGLDVITALRPVRYDWKAGYGNDRKNQLGFIAQEVEAVFPEAVSEWSMDEPTGEVDEDGTPITEKVDYKTVGPGALIPVLVKAIQELDAKNKALEARLDALGGTPNLQV